MDMRVYSLPNECVIILYGVAGDGGGWVLVPGDGIKRIPPWNGDGRLEAWKEVSAILTAATSIAVQVPNIGDIHTSQRMSEFVRELFKAATEKVNILIAEEVKPVPHE